MHGLCCVACPTVGLWLFAEVSLGAFANTLRPLDLSEVRSMCRHQTALACLALPPDSLSRALLGRHDFGYRCVFSFLGFLLRSFFPSFSSIAVGGGSWRCLGGAAWADHTGSIGQGRHSNERGVDDTESAYVLTAPCRPPRWCPIVLVRVGHAWPGGKERGSKLACQEEGLSAGAAGRTCRRVSLAVHDAQHSIGRLHAHSPHAKCASTSL